MVELGSQSQIVVPKLMELNTARNSRILCTCAIAAAAFLSLVGAVVKMLVEQVDGLACFTAGCAMYPVVP